MRTQHLLIVGLAILSLTSCGQSSVSLDYAILPDQVIVRADSTGGYVPEAYVQSHIPEFRLYGDGRVIWVARDGDAEQVWESTLTHSEVATLLEWIAGKGFFAMDDHYTVKNPPTDLPQDCVSISLKNQQKTVCEYYRGAPKAFWEIYGQLLAGAGASDQHPYQPDSGWLLVTPINWDDLSEPLSWPASMAMDLSSTKEETWLEGERLHILWRDRLKVGPWMVYEEDGERYGLVLQIPGLMPQAPDAPR